MYLLCSKIRVVENTSEVLFKKVGGRNKYKLFKINVA